MCFHYQLSFTAVTVASKIFGCLLLAACSPVACWKAVTTRFHVWVARSAGPGQRTRFEDPTSALLYKDRIIAAVFLANVAALLPIAPTPYTALGTPCISLARA